MLNPNQIAQDIATLPEPAQMLLLDLIQMLKQTHAPLADFQEDAGTSTGSEFQRKKPSRFGIWAGKVWMAEDFDEPLEDMKDYM
ncbi:MAG: DUF2281 domain-containing protein [Prochlorotrichaceae cyanobacterium]|jgi:hypothetical protein